MDDELLGMKNLGKTSVQWLHAAGIHNTADLRRLGAIQAYRAVKVRGFRASKALLYSLEGALLNRPWCELPLERKEFLDNELKSRLQAVGES
jgi:TfoX/Sxy family transcriptional regulator of competence genes